MSRHTSAAGEAPVTHSVNPLTRCSGVQEVNSVEAIKTAVEENLGAAFVSRTAVEKEVELGRLAVLSVKDTPLSRPLLCITDPGRYCSLAVRAFIRALFGLTVVTVPDGCFPQIVEVRGR